MSADLEPSRLALDEGLPAIGHEPQPETVAPVGVPQEPPPALRPDAAASTRISGIWVGIVVAALILVLLLVFVLQNTAAVQVTFFSAKGTVPLGVLLLFAIVAGVLVAAVSASLRILQIRHRLGSTGVPAGGGPAVVATGQQSEQEPGPPAQDQAGVSYGAESSA